MKLWPGKSASLDEYIWLGAPQAMERSITSDMPANIEALISVINQVHNMMLRLVADAPACRIAQADIDATFDHSFWNEQQLDGLIQGKLNK